MAIDVPPGAEVSTWWATLQHWQPLTRVTSGSGSWIPSWCCPRSVRTTRPRGGLSSPRVTAHRRQGDSPLAADLDFILEVAEEDIRQLDGLRLFVTGGTGFVGTWLLEALVWSTHRRRAGPVMEVLTRDPAVFKARSPHLTGASCVDLLQGDVCEPIATNGRADAIFHAATPASREFNEQSPRLMVDTIVDGMRNVLSVAAAAGQPRLLFTSSGAVYGRQPSEVTHLVEDSMTAPDQMSVGNAYHEGKRLAELLGAIATDEGAADVVTGRLFAFVGPHLPIDAHYAVGNFIRDALAGGPVVVEGDGSPFRSYQYAADLVVWMLALLVRGEPGRAYNVGSQDAISIADLAELVARVVGDGVPVDVRGTPVDGQPAQRYVPDCQRAEVELHVCNSVPLAEALERTATWHRLIS